MAIDPASPDSAGALPAENLLRFETSPYLLQHRDNPVHWRAWGPAALAEAKASDKPVLLSIGYAACHWCHVMAHESFEDTATAEVMNALFVNIKVDREERPDIDQLYMAALHALGDQGGWPLTMFLTPQGKPIWGGTYFPPAARYGRPSFRDVLTQIAALYRSDHEQMLMQADKITAHLARARPSEGVSLDAGLVRSAADALLGLMDTELGGTRGAPKFPNAPVLDFLARAADAEARADLAQAVEATLLGLCNGGIYDHVGGGLARYSTDARWLVPHFEKMLYDNGLFIEQLAQALPVTPHRELFRSRIEETVAWMQRELRHPDGGFSAGLDADANGVEGSFTVWTRDELDAVLPAEDAAFLAAIYDITPGGNWEGHSIPNRLAHPERLPAGDEARCQRLLDLLRAERERRPRPALDDQVLVDWNGHAIAGLATAGFLLRRDDWIADAADTYRAVVTASTRDGRLCHVAHGRVSPGRAPIRAFSTDLAALARAALALHQATGEAEWLEEADRQLAALERHHGDGAGGFYLAPDDGDALILRKSERLDEAVPNAHGMAAEAHVRLWALTGEDRHRATADAILSAAAATIRGNVFGTASLLSALDLRLRIVSLVIVVPEDASPAALLEAAQGHWRRHLVVDVRRAGEALPAGHAAFGKGAVGGIPTAYLCREGSCSLPLTDAEALAALLTEGG